MLLEGGETAKTRPAETSRWFAQTAAEILDNVAEAEKRVGSHRNKEFDSTMVDLKILANLALFHSRRIPAAVSYCLSSERGLPRWTTPSPVSKARSRPGGSLWRLPATSMPTT